MDQEPLVDISIVEIGLAVAAVGFFMAESDRQPLRFLGSFVFFTAAFFSVVAYYLYLRDWEARHKLEPGQRMTRLESWAWNAHWWIWLALLVAAIGLGFLWVEQMVASL